MIKFKSGICPSCGPASKPQPLYAKGMCYNHYWSDLKAGKDPKKNTQKSLVNQNLNQTGKQDLQKYFLYHIEHSAGRCENCDLSLFFRDKTVAFSCQAHIIPKALFPSVSANIYNHLELGGLFQKCTCHGQYDSSWKNAEKMPVFELAKKRFLLFKDFIAKDELRRLPEAFAILL